MAATLASLHVYPVKSCGGIELGEARLDVTGLADDRRWMLVRPNGRFVTQRELPRMALIHTAVSATGLSLSSPGRSTLEVARAANGGALPVTVWKFHGSGFDCGDAAALWLSEYLETPLRLVTFDEAVPRTCSLEWTGDATSTTHFSDGFPVLVISRASLADLNSRLPKALPMNRFRPNIVLDGVDAYDEDRIRELKVGGVVLRLVKPCIRCSITTTDQSVGALDGVEPLATLKDFRFDKKLLGVAFGQNAIVIRGAGEHLRVGDEFEVAWK